MYGNGRWAIVPPKQTMVITKGAGQRLAGKSLSIGGLVEVRGPATGRDDMTTRMITPFACAPQKKHRRLVKAMLLAGAAASLPVSATVAQELETITVTAKKREQSLQDVTGSVAVIDSETLVKTQVRSFEDYTRQITSLSFNNSGGGQTQLSIRGVFPSRFNHAQPQNRSVVGLLLGDIPITTSAFNPDIGLLDANRIEVLRGPQGTLYGASAQSGAIRIIPNKPSFDGLEGNVSSNVEFTRNGEPSYNFNTVLNIPVTENFAVRGAGYFIEKGGYIDNVFTGEDDINNEQSFGGRLSGLWEPTENLSFDGLVIYHNLQADGRPDEFVQGDPLVATGLVSGASLVAEPFESIDQFTITDFNQISRSTDETFNDEFVILGLTTNLDLGAIGVTSVTSYFDRAFENTLDDSQRGRDALGSYTSECFAGGFDTANPGCSPTINPFFNNSDFNQFTQELRLSSQNESALQWVAGAFFSDEQREFNQTDPFLDLDGNNDLPDLLDAFGLGVFDFGNNENIFIGFQTIDTRQVALFGEATLAFGARDEFELTAGGRWFDYDQDTDITFAGIANDGVTEIDSNISEDGFNPNFALRYNVIEDVGLYISAARGFRLGGVNDPIPLSGVFGSACASDLETLGLTELPEVFGSDSLWNYEAGVKSTLASGKVRFNAAYFYIDWSDVQTQAFLPCGFQTITNDVDIISQGFETEFAAQLNDRLVVNISGSYTDSSLDGDSVILAAEDGSRTPYVPRSLLTAGFDYTQPVEIVGESSEFFLRADIQHTSRSFSEFSENFVAPRFELPSHTSINAFLGLVYKDIEFSLYARNLTDERIVTGFDIDRRQPATFSVARPRTIGLGGRLSF